MFEQDRPQSPWIPVFFLAAALFAHFNSLHNGFTRDDYLVVSDNEFVQDLRNLPKLFDRSYLSARRDLEDVGLR